MAVLLYVIFLLFVAGNAFLFSKYNQRKTFLCGKKLRVEDVDEFRQKLTETTKVSDFEIQGNLDEIPSLSHHSVIDLLYSRKLEKIYDSNYSDGFKLAIAIEGGGMRGCVAAGMVTALWYLGLDDSVDIVYGSSAGSLIGAYLITKQLPYDGPQIYYKLLTSAGEGFIDTKSLLRSCGLGILDFRPKSIISLFTDRMGKSVLNLNFLLNDVVKTLSPLDWEKFWEKQVTKKMPLKIIASGLLSKSSVSLSAENGNFASIEELSECMKASMLLPGVSGPPIRLKGNQVGNGSLTVCNWTDYSLRSRAVRSFGSEPLMDAQLFEPIPYRSAIKDNCTHILTFRTRADGVSVTKKLSLLEVLILRRYFLKKLKMPDIADWMLKMRHKAIYAEDILRLNRESRKMDKDDQFPKICCIALPRGFKEVGRMETSKKVILANIRAGFAAAFNILVRDPSLQGKGVEIAESIWPEKLIEDDEK